jgi:hypothetical protein
MGDHEDSVMNDGGGLRRAGLAPGLAHGGASQSGGGLRRRQRGTCFHEADELPEGAGLFAVQQRKITAEALKFVACMRAHGLPAFLDPKADSRGRPQGSIAYGIHRVRDFPALAHLGPVRLFSRALAWSTVTCGLRLVKSPRPVRTEVGL